MCEVLSKPDPDPAPEQVQDACPTCGCPREPAETGDCDVCGHVQQLAPNEGQFTEANDKAATHRAYSLRRVALEAPLRQAMRARGLADRGETEADVTMVTSELLDQFTETRLLAKAYYTFLQDAGGPISAKGRQRRAVDGYLRAAAAVERLARTLGLRRQARDVTLTPQAWLTADIDQDPAELGTATARPTHENS